MKTFKFFDFPEADPSPERREAACPSATMLRAARLSVLIALALALLLLASWPLGISIFGTNLPRWPAMKFNTAISLSFLAWALLLFYRRPWSKPARISIAAICAFCAFFSLGSLFESLSGRDLGIDNLFIFQPNQNGRISPVTAGVLCLTSISLYLRAFAPHASRLSQRLVILNFFLLGLVWLGYAYDAGIELWRAFPFYSMPANTCAILSLLNLSLLLSCPNSILAIFLSQRPGSKMAKFILPSSILSLVALGFTSRVAMQLDPTDAGSDSVIIVSFGTAILAWLVWRAADLLNKADMRIEKGSEQLKALNASLEQRVFERTRALDLQATVLKNMAEGVCIVHPDDSKVIYANPKFCEIFGYSAGELDGKDVSILNFEETQGKAAQTAARLIAEIQRAGSYTYEVHNRKKDGTPFWCQATTSTFQHQEFGNVLVAVQHDISERKQQELALRRSEQRYREIVELAGDGIFEVDDSGIFEDINRAACDLFGFSREEIMGKMHFSELLSPEDHPRLMSELEALRASKSARISYWEIRKNDGTSIPVEISAKCVPGKSILGFTRDLTERRKAEANLAASERKYRTLVESAYDSVLLANEEGKIVFVNSQLGRVFGYKPEEVLGHSVEMLIPERLREAHSFKRNHFLENPHPRTLTATVDLYGRRKDGSEFPVDISLSPVATPEGVQVTAVIRDITERKKVEQQQILLAETAKALNETMSYEDRLQRTMDAMVPRFADFGLIFVLEKNELRLKARAAKASLKSVLPYGLSAEDPILPSGYLSAASVLASGKPALLESIQECAGISKNEDCGEEEKKLEALGLTSYAVIPLFVNDKAYGILHLGMTDQSHHFHQEELPFLQTVANRCALALEHARLFQQAKDAVIAREGVLSVVSHDLKNSLASVSLSAQLLATKDLSLDRAKCLGERLRRSTLLMQRLISDLLDFGKMEAGAFNIEKSTVPCSVVLQDALETLEPIAQEKGVQLTFLDANDLPDLLCDRYRIVQVLLNLMGNGIKFTPAGGSVCLSAKPIEGFVQFTVADSGTGIAPDSLDKVFERFWQEGKTATLGTGLGLSIAKGIVEAHGGEIWVESASNQGAKFHFLVPTSPADARSASVDPNPNKHLSTGT